MTQTTTGSDPSSASPAPPEPLPASIPPEFIEIVELRAASIEHRLGYFRNESFVIFSYCPGGGEVIWKDGQSSGFGTGGWRVFLYEIVPAAARRGVCLGSLDSIGTHVAVMDRMRGLVYAAPREGAEEFLADVNHAPRPRRRCLCATLDCASCPVRTCPLSAIAQVARPRGAKDEQCNGAVALKTFIEHRKYAAKSRRS